MLSLRKFLMASAGSQPSAPPNSVLPVPGISEAIRPVFFQTDLDDFLYATHGGTLFLISFQGCSYALTCRHVFQDFPKGRLFITQEKQFGEVLAKARNQDGSLKGFEILLLADFVDGNTQNTHVIATRFHS